MNLYTSFRQPVSEDDSPLLPSIAPYTKPPLHILVTPYCSILHETLIMWHRAGHSLSTSVPCANLFYQSLSETNNCDIAMVNRHAPSARSWSVTVFLIHVYCSGVRGEKASKIKGAMQQSLFPEVSKSEYKCSQDTQHHDQVQK